MGHKWGAFVFLSVHGQGTGKGRAPRGTGADGAKAHAEDSGGKPGARGANGAGEAVMREGLRQQWRPGALWWLAAPCWSWISCGTSAAQTSGGGEWLRWCLGHY